MPPRKDPDKRAKDGTGFYKETQKKTAERNKAVYETLLLRMPVGYKDRLYDFMEGQIRRIEELESIPELKQEEREELERLKRLYTLSDRHKVSVNNLVMELLAEETGIRMQVKSYQSPEDRLKRPHKKSIDNSAESV